VAKNRDQCRTAPSFAKARADQADDLELSELDRIERGRIEREPQAATGALCISVSDQGPGIPPDERERIFDRYWSRSKGGSGIGLALVRELVQALGGSIAASESEGGGARLQCVLPWPVDTIGSASDTPASSAEPMVPAEVIEPEFSQSHPAGFARAVVLVVEDEPELLAFLDECLSVDFDVLSARNGVEGAHTAREQLPDLIVTDLVMPVGDGLDLIRSLQQTEDTAAIPVVVLSAHGAPQTQFEGLESGAVEYLTKPFSPDMLRARLRRLLHFRLRLREQLRTELDQLAAAPPTTDAHSLAERVRRVVLAGMSDPAFGVEQMATALHRSRATLGRDLRDAGLPAPSQWIRDLRLEHGARLLRECRSPVAEIAYAVGYASQSHFITRFRERFGTTPSAWRKQQDALDA